MVCGLVVVGRPVVGEFRWGEVAVGGVGTVGVVVDTPGFNQVAGFEAAGPLADVE